MDLMYFWCLVRLINFCENLATEIANLGSIKDRISWHIHALNISQESRIDKKPLMK